MCETNKIQKLKPIIFHKTYLVHHFYPKNYLIETCCCWMLSTVWISVNRKTEIETCNLMQTSSSWWWCIFTLPRFRNTSDDALWLELYKQLPNSCSVIFLLVSWLAVVLRRLVRLCNVPDLKKKKTKTETGMQTMRF